MVILAASVLSAILATHTPATVLDAVRLASGGSAWEPTRALVADGRKKSIGLAGRYHEIDDLKTGFFIRSTKYGSFANASEGLNASGRWRMDFSGAIHTLNSREAVAVAITEAYLARHAYLRLDRTVRSRIAPGIRNDSFYVIEITPKGGRAATLWIRKTTLLLARVTIARSEREEIIRFSNYRTVAGLRLPFVITIDNGDELESGTTSIAAYRPLATLEPKRLQRPAIAADVKLAGAAETTILPARVDAATGFLIVRASVNGRGPLPFILDSGGHDILTPVAARALGLPLLGGGKSFGAGSGTTPTRYTSVASLKLGAATVSKQPFTVLYLDLGYVSDVRGRTPIAGILGLEIFERFVVTIDEGAARLTLATARSVSTRGRRVPLTFTSDMPLTDASVDGTQGVFAVDTANNAGLIVFGRWLRANKLCGRIRYGRVMGGESVGGTIAMRDATAVNFHIAGTDFKSVPIVVSDARAGSLSARSEAGNIGLSMLSRFARVTFDYRHGLMLLERSP